jgi:NAD(P)-dependent dehydrogenase (short-subunit alcohol dehydrogenase family)
MKNCLITGASGLIGSEMVREFLAQGMKVFGLDLVGNSQLKHPDYTFIKTDISNEAQVKAALKQIKSLDILVNNGAKASPENPPIEKLSLKQWEKVINSNLTSVFLLSKYAVPVLKKTKGSIINIASTRHLMCEPHTEIYSTSKGGIVSLTRALAISLAGEVRVNSISPGWIADPKNQFPDSDHQQHPVKRIGRPSDIAKLTYYLASDEAGFITGQDFVVDGGMTVKMIYRD